MHDYNGGRIYCTSVSVRRQAWAIVLGLYMGKSDTADTLIISHLDPDTATNSQIRYRHTNSWLTSDTKLPFILNQRHRKFASTAAASLGLNHPALCCWPQSSLHVRIWAARGYSKPRTHSHRSSLNILQHMKYAWDSDQIGQLFSLVALEKNFSVMDILFWV